MHFEKKISSLTSFCDILFSGLPLVVEEFFDQRIHICVSVWLLCALLFDKVGDRRSSVDFPLLGLHLRHGVPILPPNR